MNPCLMRCGRAFKARSTAFATSSPKPSPLGAVEVLVSAGRFNVRASAPSPLGSPAVLGFADWTGLTTGLEITPFLLDLVTPSGTVRVPMSSWQATLQVENQCFASAVIPSCAEWIDTLDQATEFRISRRVTLTNGTTIENPLVTCPLDTLQIDQGPTNHTATVSGYFDAFAEVTDPYEEFDRTLQGVRSISTYASGVRLRCALDYLLLPGMRAHYGDASSLIVAYLNTYVRQSGRSPQAYMDVGSRAV
jgi:hypothetical protein